MGVFKKIFKSRSKKKGVFYLSLSKILGFTPKHVFLYQLAFTHKSTNQKDAQEIPINYERLEFLGDAMLGAIISEYLYKMTPSGDEGYLTKMRSKVVSRQHLNKLGSDLKLINLLKAKIPKESFGDNIHGNLFESLIGAIFLDKGYDACKAFVNQKVIKPHVNINQLESEIISYKSLLIEWCQKNKKEFRFEAHQDEDNKSSKYYRVALFIGKNITAKAKATSRKKAEEKASKKVYFLLKV